MICRLCLIDAEELLRALDDARRLLQVRSLYWEGQVVTQGALNRAMSQYEIAKKNLPRPISKVGVDFLYDGYFSETSADTGATILRGEWTSTQLRAIAAHIDAQDAAENCLPPPVVPDQPA